MASSPVIKTVLLDKESDATKNKESVSTKNTKESDPIKNTKESDPIKNTKEPYVTKNTEESDASKDTKEPDSSKNVNESDSSKPTKEPDAFKVERDEGDTFVRVFNSTLIEALRRYLPRECLYEQHPKVPINELFLVLTELKKAIGRDSEQKKDKETKETKKPQKPSGSICDDDVDYDSDEYDEYDDDDQNDGSNNNNNKHLELLVDLIEKEYESRVYRIKKMIENNVISFKNLFYLFPKGQHIRALWNERIVGAKVTKIMYRRGCFGAEFMLINAEVIDSDGITFVHGTKSFYIGDWEGVCNIDELPVVPLPEEGPIRDELIARGKKFVKYAIGPHYLQYSGNIFRHSWFGNILFRSSGRVMVDTVSFAKINPSYEMGTAKKSSQSSYYYDNSSRTTIGRTVKEEELFMCAPTLFGFSFVAKKWGQIYVDQLEDIKFDDDAFDQLVMDPTKKDLISSLVTSKHQGMDLISGKGGGCIFLLHGPPGVGKTLTAEAISEYLHRPLYAVSVGELGMTIVELEKKLSEILEVANVWNAVILIDEADIFLERRSEHDIKRNGLVSIFLRLLEYHQGILFLTTNRVKCFDAAFQSRISVALKYNDLDADARGQVWRTFLERAEGKGRSNVDIENLKKRPLNGREIKTAVRLAKALATKNNPDALITTKQLETILDISKSFSEEISGS